MDPEKRLLVIHKYLPVKGDIIFICTFARVLCPKWVGIVQRNRTLYDLELVFGRLYLDHLLAAILFFLFFHLGIGMDFLDHGIGVALVCYIDGLIFFRCIFL